MGFLAVKRQQMYTNYFDEYQKQFSDWQEQFSEWQKKFFDTWLDNLPNTKAEVDLSETFDKTLKFQQELVTAYLETQEKTSRMILESQKKFWDEYFARLRKQSATSKA
jgi:hypothetical protein